MRNKKEIIPFNFDVVYEDYQYLYKQQDKKPFRTLQIQFLVSWIWNGENDKAQQVIGSTKESWFLHKENDFKKTKNINRCHITSQKKIVEKIFSKFHSKKELYRYLSRYDKCILGTSKENMKKEAELLYIKFKPGYFRCQTVGYRHNKIDTEYLKSLMKKVA